MDMLPVFADIARSDIRRNYAVVKLAEKSFLSDSLVPIPTLDDAPLSDFAEKPPLEQELLPTRIHCHHHGSWTAGPTSRLPVATPCGSL